MEIQSPRSKNYKKKRKNEYEREKTYRYEKIELLNARLSIWKPLHFGLDTFYLSVYIVTNTGCSINFGLTTIATKKRGETHT